MKTIDSQNLVINELYYDCADVNYSTLLKFVRQDDTSYYFTFVSGQQFYKADIDGFITFPKLTKFYQTN
jgi:hypothetical protein